MKIVIVVGSSVVGGAEKQSLLLAKFLSVNFQVQVIFIGPPGPIIGLASKYGIDFMSSRGNLLSDLITLYKGLSKNDVICQVNFLYRADILGGIVGRLLRVHTIINSARNTSWPGFSRAKMILLRTVSRFVPDYIVANSQESADWHISIGYPNSKFQIIPNFLDAELEFTQSIKRIGLHHPIRLGIASRAVPGKGHKTLIEAIKILENNGIVCEAWFKGYGVSTWNMVVYEKRNVRINLQEGELELGPWFRDIDIYCGISELWESDSNSVNEAILNNVPVIVSHLIPNERYSPPPIQIQTGNPKSIAEGILNIQMLSEVELTKSCNLRRSNLIIQRDTSKITEKWVRLIQKPFLI